MKKILCICVALILTLSCASVLAEDDLQAQLDAANARIAELEAEVETYKPYYIASIVATYGDGKVILLSDVQEQYDEMDAQYQSYGYSLADFGMEETTKISIVKTAVEDAILMEKAAELGLDVLSEEAEAVVQMQAQEEMNYYNEYYCSYYYGSDDGSEVEYTEEQMAEAEQFWAMQGVTADTFYDGYAQQAIKAAVYDYVIKDVEVTEDDIQTAYQQMVSDDESSYKDNDYMYNTYRNNGTTIHWNPEGYRAVKQILIKFDDDQAARYDELSDQLTSLQEEQAALDAIAAGEQEADPEVEYRTAEEIAADIEAVNADMDALYQELMPTAEEAIAAFNNGTDINEVIAQYNGDPGMTSEPTATIGYAVSADSTTYDPAFTAAAMSIEEIGQLSEPARGSYGLYIVYYLSDITPGAVAYEDCYEDAKELAKSDLENATYEATMAQWEAEQNVVYYWESFGVDPANV